MNVLEAMPLEAYEQYHPSTPEATIPCPQFDSNGHSRNASGSSTWSSPDSALSVATRATTPSVSPQKQNGPNILPKIRTQDQGLEQNIPTKSFHRRAQSHDIDAQFTVPSYRPGYQRSTTSPPEFSSDLAPISAASTLSPWVDSAAQSPLPFSSTYAQSQVGHGRSTSTSSVDPSTFRPLGNPYYRSLPVYITHDSPQYPAAVLPPTLDDFISFPLAAPADLRSSRGLTPELIFGPGDDLNATSTLSTYLTEPNPSVFPIEESSRGYGDGRVKHFWWDVRNIRSWDDFNLSTISSIPGLSTLLNIEIKASGLPAPGALSHSALKPPDLSTLANTIKNFHVAKVNAALLASQGHNHATMTLVRNPQDGAYFISNHANEQEGTLSNRGRVIGLVKPYERWNSGKRQEPGQKRVEYLQHLAHLQVLLRQHNCRYGFLVTEIELICVRLGTEPTTPDFGFLELSRPIAMNTCRKGNDIEEEPAMTACLALWYLNMLAGNSPLDGQCGFKIDVGPPEAQSRAKVFAEGIEGRDDWMPKVHTSETRSARTTRGWAWPEDPVHRGKEGVCSGRGRKR